MNETIFLRITPPLNESDSRNTNRSSASASRDVGPFYVNQWDWRVWSGSGFGKRLQSALPAGRGYSFEVTDMGRYVSARASYHSSSTGKSVAKTFIISFDDPKLGDGVIFATSTKWRTFSNVDQAASYINQTIRSLAGSTES